MAGYCALRWFRQLGLAAVLLATGACAPPILPLPPASAAMSRTDGNVVRVDGAPNSDPDANVRLVVQTEGGIVHVELAPGWYLDERGLRFSKEEAISIDGRHQVKNGEDVVVAHRIRSKSATVELRDEREQPVWRQ
jgi:hypothetical protein